MNNLILKSGVLKQKIEKQFKSTLLKKNLLIRKFLCTYWNFGIQNKKQSQSNLFCIRNSKYNSYNIGNPKGLCKLKLKEGKTSS